ncbi:MAG TPA: histidinol dehydrogenase, partial [Cellvibrionales bacterium]|nr:histidinol dehydrogenase [Cellvibrionales bacterium]
KYEKKFNKNNILVPSKKQISKSILSLDKKTKLAIDIAYKRILKFHSLQKFKNIIYVDKFKNKLEYKYIPIESAAIYVPGSTASYPSSVLMNALPAKVAGVDEIIMVSPSPGGEVNQTVLAAAAIAGIDKIFTIGGAQAIAALAYGTESIPRVDKIVGPGNRFVACAKKMVFGDVGLDMLAGPSEILVICDGKTNPDWIAMDLFSQAEHDEDAQAILISPSSDFLQAVEDSMNSLIGDMSRSDIIRQSISQRAAFILVDDLNQAVAVSNAISPEHLELSIDDPELWLSSIQNAGAIFMGRFTPESVGDYCAGPNHVLPTSTTARFASPLGVYDFQKRSSLIQCSAESSANIGRLASVVARSESLTAHARSAEMRIESLARDDKEGGASDR